jgi:hypothetical protein
MIVRVMIITHSLLDITYTYVHEYTHTHTLHTTASVVEHKIREQ